jgi:hypothetical protein
MAYHVPHRRNDATESAEQHRGRKVHGLIWLLLVALGRLARTEVCQHCLRQIEVHESRYGKSAIVEGKARLERVFVLMTMASEVENVG